MIVISTFLLQENSFVSIKILQNSKENSLKEVVKTFVGKKCAHTKNFQTQKDPNKF